MDVTFNCKIFYSLFSIAMERAVLFTNKGLLSTYYLAISMLTQISMHTPNQNVLEILLQYFFCLLGQIDKW